MIILWDFFIQTSRKDIVAYNYKRKKMPSNSYVSANISI